jgi:hypothetical protein
MLAIIFALSDKFSQLTKQEKRLLLHVRTHTKLVTYDIGWREQTRRSEERAERL